MIEVVFFRVHHDQLGRLRGWLRELTERADETRATFAQEGTRHERAWLLHDHQGPILVYAMEVDDPERARRAYAASTLPIDQEHKQVMRQVTAGRVDAELLYDLSANPD
jgi:Family of unknown function (DUF6176)